ncbi:ATP-dependent endonuclease [Methylobacterium bullatum]|uniref:AAA+ ATPase domain-containing protein n=1 Tax=Methylobacterium bullatum TaxID=570505 RepID=A0AAV4Z915_9HYPH|nr:AAA family ATPase [Methylobacterium bullatum]MBD8901863.1 ATPase [Methylobacterium bullatum]GJD40609.1 hypothetical protein OICFNHDK_3081 [Methylobacterium bullatum]
MRLHNLRFKAGESPNKPSLEIKPGKITVFIGPNNGGKSLALRELYQFIATGRANGSGSIFENIALSTSQEEIEQKRVSLRLKKKIGEELNSPLVTYGRGNVRRQVHEATFMHAIAAYTQTGNYEPIAQVLLAPYALNLDGQNRLSLINPASAERLQDQQASTLGSLFVNNSLRQKLSSIIYSAFNYHLLVDPTGMSTFSYALSVDAPLNTDIERSLNDESVAFYGRALPVSAASDGTKAFIGIMAEILAGDPEVLFIDEPEAFLHKSLQYALGREIAANISLDKQVFIATHSPDFLMGCLASGEEVDVVRLTYHGGLSNVRLLPASKLSEMMNDPLFRSVGVLSALFYQSAIIVEGASDSAFYDEINNRLERYSNGAVKHAIFLNAHSKQSAAELARPLRKIGIPTAMLLDIDWIKEDGQVAVKYLEAAGLPSGLYEGKLAERRQVRKFLEADGRNYKRLGGINLLDGEEMKAASEFLDTMDRYGLFTVRAGEVESWLGSTGVARDKSKWLANIFRAMGSNPADDKYMTPKGDDVWAFLRKVSAWVADEGRAGVS